MRIYGMKRIPAAIKRKTDVISTALRKTRPLTEEDFEIVPEHDEEVLLEVRCEICGDMAEYIPSNDEESSLVSLQCFRWTPEVGEGECTQEFLPEYWYEVCERCMKTRIVPFLMSVRRSDLPLPDPEEPALLTETDSPFRRMALSRGEMIGVEDEGIERTSLPPITDKEPF